MSWLKLIKNRIYWWKISKEKKHKRTHTDSTSLLQEIRSLMKRFLETNKVHSSKKEINYSIKFFLNLPFKKKSTWQVPFIDLASAPWEPILSGFLLRATEIIAQCSARLWQQGHTAANGQQRTFYLQTGAVTALKQLFFVTTPRVFHTGAMALNLLAPPSCWGSDLWSHSAIMVAVSSLLELLGQLRLPHLHSI